MNMTLEQLRDWITRLPEPFQPVKRQADAIEEAIRERDRLRGDVDGLRGCAERAEAELATLKDENAQLRDVLADRDMDREMAAHANKELAALKARTADAPVSDMHRAIAALEKMAAALDRRPWIAKLFSRAGSDAMRYASCLVARSSSLACNEITKRMDAEEKLDAALSRMPLPPPPKGED